MSEVSRPHMKNRSVTITSERVWADADESTAPALLETVSMANVPSGSSARHFVTEPPALIALS